MKELSIEEKAKAYDEALKVLHKYDGANIMFTQDLKEEMFPELKESEDERIRKALINYFQVDGCICSNIPCKDIRAWLEKQGKNNMGISEATKKKLEDSLNEALEKETPESLNEFLDEQGEQNQKHFELKAGHWYICHRAFCCRADHLTVKEGERFMCKKDGVVKGFVIKEPEKYFKEVCAPAPMEDEQKPSDKVEPKFKVGDWCIDNEDSTIFQIVKVLHNTYTHKTIEGQEYSCAHYWLENDARLWNIQDAKTGDVLACPNDAGDRDVVFIFKNINSDEGWVFCYCAIDANGCFCTNNDYVGNSNSTNISPATKEQRDTLFARMKEAGYEWVTDKKELRKIEQKPSITIPKFKVGDKVYALGDGFECTIESIDETCYYGDTTNFDIKDQDDWALVEQKPVTHKYNVGATIYYKSFGGIKSMVVANVIDTGDGNPMYKDADGNDVFEKDLILQMHVEEQEQTWSEEDEKIKKSIITGLEMLKDGASDKSLIALYNKKIDWLKSLKDRYTWKPSDEHLEAIKDAIEFLGCTKKVREDLKSLYEQLKKLREE